MSYRPKKTYKVKSKKYVHGGGQTVTRTYNAAQERKTTQRAKDTGWHEIRRDNREREADYGMEYDDFRDDTAGMGLDLGDDPLPLELLRQRHPRRRNNARIRKARADNWRDLISTIVAVHQGTQSDCNCTPTQQSWRLRIISLHRIQYREIHSCTCKYKIAALIRDGLFPASPSRPTTAFNIRLLRLLHNQVVRGPLSKYAWADGLRASLEYEHGRPVTSFYRQLLEAYHAWIEMEKMIEEAICTQVMESEMTDIGDTFDPATLANMCPACFDFSSIPGDKDVLLTIDGNMQHTRFKDRRSWEFEEINPKAFVNYKVRRYYLASDERGILEAANRRAVETACGSHFKAANGFSRTEFSTQTKKLLDESGLMVATCFHGVGLRYLNLHNSGERHSHGVALLKAIEEQSGATKMKLCYDIGCKCEASLTAVVPTLNNVRIGRFHIYGHEYRCHVLFGTLSTPGYGLMVGEEPEQIWWQMSHLVRSGRVSSGPRRTQAIDSFALFNAKRYKERMGMHLNMRWKKVLEVEKQASELLQELYNRPIPSRPGRNIDAEYIKIQRNEQAEHYRSYRCVRHNISSYQVVFDCTR